MMDVIFSDEEMASSCYQKLSPRFVKPGLDEKRVYFLEGCLIEYYGEASFLLFKDTITKRCNQKCRDRARDKNKPRRLRRRGVRQTTSDQRVVLDDAQMAHLEQVTTPGSDSTSDSSASYHEFEVDINDVCNF